MGIESTTWRSRKAHDAICEAAEGIANRYCDEDDTYIPEVQRLTVAISEAVDRADLPRATADSILRPLCADHPHVRFVEGVLGGVQPLIEGHRIGISHLLGRMAIGMSVTEYQETWGFNDDVIKDAFAYAQDVIDALIDRERGTPRATGDTTVEACLDVEIARLRDGVRDHLIKLGAPDCLIDGTGCDSGDPLDFIKAEITQAFNYFQETDNEPNRI